MLLQWSAQDRTSGVVKPTDQVIPDLSLLLFLLQSERVKAIQRAAGNGRGEERGGAVAGQGFVDKPANVNEHRGLKTKWVSTLSSIVLKSTALRTRPRLLLAVLVVPQPDSVTSACIFCRSFGCRVGSDDNDRGERWGRKKRIDNNTRTDRECVVGLRPGFRSSIASTAYICHGYHFWEKYGHTIAGDEYSFTVVGPGK